MEWFYKKTAKGWKKITKNELPENIRKFWEKVGSKLQVREVRIGKKYKIIKIKD